MITNSSTKDGKIEDQVQEKWKSKLSAFGYAVNIKEDILSICTTSVFIHIFHDP